MVDNGKVILWCYPRTLSTAFSRAILNNKNVKVLLEPYVAAYMLGTERIYPGFEHIPAKEGFTYNDAKAICERHDVFSPVFIKEMPVHFGLELEKSEFIPKGFRHAFLIRNPRKSVYSYYKLEEKVEGFKMIPEWIGIKQTYMMLQHVIENIDKNPLVIDAEDLLTHTAEVIKEFCARTGLPYSESMVDWKTESSVALESLVAEIGDFAKPCFKDAISSKSLDRKYTTCDGIVDEKLSEELQQCIEENMVYYDKMYRMRWRPGGRS